VTPECSEGPHRIDPPTTSSFRGWELPSTAEGRAPLFDVVDLRHPHMRIDRGTVVRVANLMLLHLAVIWGGGAVCRAKPPSRGPRRCDRLDIGLFAHVEFLDDQRRGQLSGVETVDVHYDVDVLGGSRNSA